MDASFEHPQCQACGLCERCITPFMEGHGPQGGVLVIGESPGESEDESGRPFVGESGRLLRRELKQAGIDPDGVRYTNAVRCHPLNNKLPSKKPAKHCFGFLEREIKQVKPRAIFLLGGTAAGSVLNRPTIGKNRLTKFDYQGVLCSIGYHPAYVLRDCNELSKFREDIRFFRDYILGKRTKDATINGKLFTDPTPKQIKAFTQKVLKNKMPFAFDFETNTLSPYLLGDKLIVMCCAVSDGKSL